MLNQTGKNFKIDSGEIKHFTEFKRRLNLHDWKGVILFKILKIK